MGGKSDKAPNFYPTGTKDQTDTLSSNGRSVFAEREMVSSTFEDMSNLTASQIPLPTSDVEMEVVSNSANDSASGTGCQSVLIIALGADFIESFNFIPLQGLTSCPVQNKTGGSAIRRINTFLLPAVGTECGGADGTIVIRDKNDNNIVYSQMDPGENSSAQALRTVPANTTALFPGWYCASWTIAKILKFRFQTTFNIAENEVTPGVFTTRDRMEMSSDHLYKPFPVPFVIPAQTDLIINAEVQSGGTANGLVSYQYFIQRS